MADQTKSQNLLTPKFRASYVHLFKPRAVKPGDAPKYQITALFEDDPEVPKGSSTIADLKKAALAAAYEKWGDTEETRKRIKNGKYKTPFITGDRLQGDIDDGKVPEGITLMMRFNSPETSRPGLVDRFRGPDGKPMPITDEEVFFSGCYARAEVRAFAYDRPDSKGVTFALNNVQKLGDGERLGGGKKKAADAFDALDDSPPTTDGVDEVEDGDDNPMGL